MYRSRHHETDVLLLTLGASRHWLQAPRADFSVSLVHPKLTCFEKCRSIVACLASRVECGDKLRESSYDWDKQKKSMSFLAAV